MAARTTTRRLGERRLALSRRAFIAGLLALPVVRKIDRIARVVLPERVYFRGREFLEAGYVWMPYIPVVYTSTILDPKEWDPKTRERYSKSKLRPEYYGTVSVKDIKPPSSDA